MPSRSGAHHLGGGPPPRASQRRQQQKSQPRPLYREGGVVHFRGNPATFLEHVSGGQALIRIGSQRWRVPISELS
jgi:hypothetical protein